VTGPVFCIVADAGAEDVEVGGVDDEALLLALKAEDWLEPLVELVMTAKTAAESAP
jgi:hypothetical protein